SISISSSASSCSWSSVFFTKTAATCSLICLDERDSPSVRRWNQPFFCSAMRGVLAGGGGGGESALAVVAGDAQRDDGAWRRGPFEHHLGEVLGPRQPLLLDDGRKGAADLGREVTGQGRLAHLAHDAGALLHHRARQLRHPRGRRARARAEGKDVQ